MKKLILFLLIVPLAGVCQTQSYKIKETTPSYQRNGERTYEVENTSNRSTYRNPQYVVPPTNNTAKVIQQTSQNFSNAISNIARNTAANPAAKKEQGVFYLGQGKLTIVEVGGSGFVSLKKLGKRCDAKIEEYVSLKGLTYKLIDSEQRKGLGVFPKVSKTYLLYTPDGKIYSNEDDASSSKENAKKELMELKEYLDLGIITQEEFDKKAVSLKKILLGN